jgi:hypothetical protein
MSRSRDDGGEDFPLTTMIPRYFTKPRCVVCGVEFPRNYFVADDYRLYSYCDEHWKERPDEHRDSH